MEEKHLTKNCIKNIGHSLHWLRADAKEGIKACAERLYISVQELEELERGNDFYLDISLVCQIAQLYGEKICITIGEGDEI